MRHSPNDSVQPGERGTLSTSIGIQLARLRERPPAYAVRQDSNGTGSEELTPRGSCTGDQLRQPAQLQGSQI